MMLYVYGGQALQAQEESHKGRKPQSHKAAKPQRVVRSSQRRFSNKQINISSTLQQFNISYDSYLE